MLFLFPWQPLVSVCTFLPAKLKMLGSKIVCMHLVKVALPMGGECKGSLGLWLCLPVVESSNIVKTRSIVSNLAYCGTCVFLINSLVYFMYEGIVSKACLSVWSTKLESFPLVPLYLTLLVL